MSRYKAYPAYKDSGVEWLGEIPPHWHSRQLKYLCSYNDEVLSEATSDDYEIEYVDIGSVSAIDGISNTETMLFGDAPSRARRIVRDGDILISTVRTYLEAIASVQVPPNNLVASTGFAVIRPNAFLNKVYAAYCLRASGFIKEVVARSVGVSYPAINASDLVNIKNPEPSIAEQEKIAAFLDHETAKIDALIEKQQRLIELLKEKRLSLVHYATKDVPEVRLENCARLISRPISKSSEELFTPIGIYNRGRGIFHKDESLACDLGDSDFFYIKGNDLIFSGQFAWEGAVALADSNDDGCIASHRYPILTGMDNLLSTSYLWAFFTSQRGDFLLSENSRGAAGRNRPLNMNSLMKEKIPLPKLEDQLAVSKVVYQEKIISERVATVIATLQERRTALISAAVTGKIDVRDWQPAAAQAGGGVEC